MNDLIEKLKTTCEWLNDEYSLNQGGCMYAAYIISKHLEKLNIIYTVNMWYDENNDPYHISIVINGIDINKTDYILHDHIENITVDSKWLMDFNNRNEKFDFIWQRKYKKIVRDTFKKLFIEFK